MNSVTQAVIRFEEGMNGKEIIRVLRPEEIEVRVSMVNDRGVTLLLYKMQESIRGYLMRHLDLSGGSGATSV